MLTFLIDLLLTAHILVSLLLVLVVLMQRPRSEGLGTAFASGMVEQYIGPATGVLVRFTTWLAGIFFVLTVLLAFLYAHQTVAKSAIGAKLRAAATPKPLPTATVAPAPPVIVAPAVSARLRRWWCRPCRRSGARCPRRAFARGCPLARPADDTGGQPRAVPACRPLVARRAGHSSRPPATVARHARRRLRPSRRRRPRTVAPAPPVAPEPSADADARRRARRAAVGDPGLTCPPLPRLPRR